MRTAIDAALNENPADLAAFLQIIQTAGYEVKQGKYLAFRAPGQERFTGLRSLKGDYTDEAVIERIYRKRTVPKREAAIEPAIIRSTAKVNLLIDIQNSIKAKNNLGYE